MFLDCGRKPEYPVRTHAERPPARSRTRIFLLQGKSATNCATVQPHLDRYKRIYRHTDSLFQKKTRAMENFPEIDDVSSCRQAGSWSVFYLREKPKLYMLCDDSKLNK
ncbi:hypothetical protein AMECASPLE_033887 [Ameca splendens]|uniref:Uncharacterized protein n=1 Tax=Ameca splendens TaxID=208324 RepID=A0ABV1A2R6_9TELE